MNKISGKDVVKLIPKRKPNVSVILLNEKRVRGYSVTNIDNMSKGIKLETQNGTNIFIPIHSILMVIQNEESR